MNPRIALRFEDWPEDIQAAWLRATTPRHALFGSDGVAAKHSPYTLNIWLNVVGLFLAHLVQNGGELRSGLLPLVSQEHIESFVAGMRQRGVRNISIRTRLASLASAIRVLAPGKDVGFILNPGGVSIRKLLPMEPKHVPVRDYREIRDCALALYREGQAGRGYARGRAAIRDAAIIATMAVRAPRRGAFSSARVSDLEKIDGVYWLSLPATTSKTRTPLRYALASECTEVFDQYLDEVRPAFGGNRSEALWMGTRQQPLPPADIGRIVRRRTKQWFGQGRGPHWLRACVTTTATMEDPIAAFDAAIVLGHSATTALKHYNKATGVAALDRHGVRIQELEDRTRLLAGRAFGWSDRGKERLGKATNSGRRRSEPGGTELAE